jgi:Domain of unknown function (DUF4365)
MTTPRRRKVWQHDTENISDDQIREYFHRIGWEVERFGKDYGEDLFIRIFEEGAFTGKACYVQLKGTNNIQQYALKTGVFSYGVDVVNLLQWHRNQFPVIFVLWDIEQRVGYWLHIQSYVDKRLKKEPLWLKQEEGKRNIHIPFDQIIPWGEDNALLTLINAEQPLWQMLAKVNQQLDEADSHHRLEAHLTSTGTEITTVEKYPGASADKPINIKFTTSVPIDTEEGRDLVEKIKRFISSGVPVKVPLPYVKNLEFPEFIKQALPEFTEEGFFVLGTAHNPKPLLLRFEFSNDGGEHFTLEYVQLNVVYAGKEEITLTNDDQPLPITVTLVLRSNGTISTQLALKSTLNVHQVLMQLRLKHYLSKPYTVQLINLETGMSLAHAQHATGEPDAPPLWLLQTTEALYALQIKARKPITIPDRELTDDEWQMLDQLRRIVHEGKIEGTWNHVSPTVSILPEDLPGAKQLIAPFEEGKSGNLTLYLEETVTLFDVDLPLGKIKPIHIQAKLMNEQEVKEKLAEQKESEIQLKFVPSGDPTIIKEYLDWVTDTGETT